MLLIKLVKAGIVLFESYLYCLYQKSLSK